MAWQTMHYIIVQTADLLGTGCASLGSDHIRMLVALLSNQDTQGWRPGKKIAIGPQSSVQGLKASCTPLYPCLAWQQTADALRARSCRSGDDVPKGDCDNYRPFREHRPAIIHINDTAEHILGEQDLQEIGEAGVSVGYVAVGAALHVHQGHDDMAQCAQRLVDAGCLPQPIPCSP